MLPVALAAALVVLPPSPEFDMRLVHRWKYASVTGPHLLADKLRDEAVELRKANKPADALPLINAALLFYPKSTFIRIDRAKTFAALGRYDEQADDYAWVLANCPQSYSMWVWQYIAEGWIDRGKWDEATQCFEHALGQTPPGELRSQILLREADYWLGDDHDLDTLKGLPRERLMAAHLALCDALEFADLSRPARQYALASRAWVRYARGWFAEAAADYDEVLKLKPTDSGVHNVRALIAHELKDYAKALHHYEAAEKHGYDPIEMASAKCSVLLTIGEYERAKAVVEDWVRLAPKDKDAALCHAVTLRLVGKDDEADQVSRAAVLLSVRTLADQTWYELYALGQCGELDAADRLLTRQIATTTDTEELARAYCNRCHLRRYRGLVEEAIDDMSACMRLRPEYYTPEWFGQRWLSLSGDTTSAPKAYLANR